MKRSFLFFGFALMGILAGSISAVAQTDARSNTVPVENKSTGEVQKKPVNKQAKVSPLHSRSVTPVSTVNSNKEATPAKQQEPASKQPVTSNRNDATPAATKSSK